MEGMTFEEACAEYRHRLFMILYRLTGDADEAEDVLQDALMSALASWDSFRNESSRYTWLCSIAIRRAHRHVAKRRRALSRSAYFGRLGVSELEFLEGIDGSRRSVEDELLTEEVREHCLQTFLECLPRKQRIVFTLRLIMGLSVRETAGVCGLSEDAVKITLFRAKNRIREIVGKRCDLFDAANPCSCWKWAAHFEDTGRGPGRSPLAPTPGNHARLRERIGREADFLRKLTAAYGAAERPAGDGGDGGLEPKLRELIAAERMRLLS